MRERGGLRRPLIRLVVRTLALPDERVVVLGTGLYQAAIDGSRKARIVDADGEILTVLALALPGRADFAGAGG